MYGQKPEGLGDLVLNSSEIQPGDVFIAIKGLQTDGHLYIPQALKAGASVIICEDIPDDVDQKSACFIEVANTRSLVGPLAQLFAGNPAEKLMITGVTGTNGKTTVTTLLHQVLSELGIASSLSGTVQTLIGSKSQKSRLTTADPVSIARTMKDIIASGSTHLSMEVSSHALDQRRVEGIDFDFAAFTNLSHDHLDYHGSLEAYAEAKKKLFDGLSADAVATVNFDDSYGPDMVQDTKATVQSFGFENDHAEVPCTIIAETTDGTTFQVGDITLHTPLLGRFNAYNAAQTYLISRAMGYDQEKIKKALAEAKGAEGRMEQVRISQDQHDGPLVLVDYAHTPDALENVLDTLQQLKRDGQPLHVVFGAGGDRDKTKRPEMARIAENYADRITVTSDNPRTEPPVQIIKDITDGFSPQATCNKYIDRGKAIRSAIKQAGPDEIVVIAGKGHETYQEIDGKRIDFDDRAIAKEALKARIQETGTTNTQTSEVG